MEAYSKVNLAVETGVDEDFYFEYLRDSHSGIQFVLKGSKSLSTLEINFKFVYSYTKTNESYRLSTLNKIPDNRYLMLQVEGSDYLDWFHSESQGIYSNKTVYHFMFVAGDYLLDVLSNSVPEIKFQLGDTQESQFIPVDVKGVELKKKGADLI